VLQTLRAALEQQKVTFEARLRGSDARVAESLQTIADLEARLGRSAGL
jgi:hypothetical protein